ncbi:MAG: sugar phosphate isomerase/epimerase [Planctomycetes bacterium]|jgi:sugar phosphate isomerase/epimerase|nr:sugar phosphate isomerase/epimerase [Planctomycetota bacterium]
MTRIAINTLAFYGHSLDTALAEIAQLADAVEPVFISKYDPTLSEAYFTADNAAMLRRRLEGLGLRVVSMGSHMDLGRPDSVDVFRRRMEFAHALGARIILTNASSRSQEETFDRNIEALAVQAEKLDLVIALENPGDGAGQLLGTGMDGLAILEKLGSDRVRLNYDFSNVFTYSQGKCRPEQELAAVLPYLGHLHLKNVTSREGAWPVCALGEGVIDYRSLFRRFPALWDIPMSLELPLRFGYDNQFNFALRETPAAMPLERVRGILNRSLEYLREVMP